MDIYVVSMSWLFWIGLLGTLGCMDLFELEFCLDICPGVGLPGHMVALFLVFWGTSVLFSIVAAPTYIPPNSVGGFSLREAVFYRLEHFRLNLPHPQTLVRFEPTALVWKARCLVFELQMCFLLVPLPGWVNWGWVDGLAHLRPHDQPRGRARSEPRRGLPVTPAHLPHAFPSFF